MISYNINDFINKNLIITSGGFDPLHVGHIRCIVETSKIGKENNLETLIIVNGDGFLERKKKYSFMKEADRAEIISAIDGVDHILIYDDGSQFVSKALEILKPKYFTKGGDRSMPENVPEVKICSDIGTIILYGIGGTEKINSSSILVTDVADKLTKII